MVLTKEDEWLLNKWKSAPAEIKETAASDLSGTSFDCNICLDLVQEPVVTLCGHLYCWPCIYKWINFHRTFSDCSDQQQQHQAAYCPLCKTKLSTATVVPLYGRGQTTKPSKVKALELGQVPRRPSGPCREILSPLIRSNHQSPSRDNLNARGSVYTSSRSLLNLGGVSTTGSTFNPVIGMLSEMVYTKMFGNSVSRIYNHPNSYNLGDSSSSSSSPRMRRREMQADKSLSRICFFVFCCVMVCLILF